MATKILVIIFLFLIYSPESYASTNCVYPQDVEEYVYDNNVHYVGNNIDCITCIYLTGPTTSRESVSYDHIAYPRNSKIVEVVPPQSCGESGYIKVQCGYSESKGSLWWKRIERCSRCKTIKLVKHDKNTSCEECRKPVISALSHADYKISLASAEFRIGGTFTISSTTGCCKYKKVSTGGYTEYYDLESQIVMYGIKAKQLTYPNIGPDDTFTVDINEAKKFEITDVIPGELIYDSNKGLAYARIMVKTLENAECLECEGCKGVFNNLYYIPIDTVCPAYLRIISVRDLRWRNYFINEDSTEKGAIRLPPEGGDIHMLRDDGERDKLKMGYAVEFMFVASPQSDNSRIEIIPELIRNENEKIEWYKIKDGLTDNEINPKFSKVVIYTTDNNKNDSFLTEAENTGEDVLWKWVYYLPPKITYPGARKTDIITIKFNIQLISDDTKIFDMSDYVKTGWQGKIFKYSMNKSLLDDIYNNAAN